MLKRDNCDANGAAKNREFAAGATHGSIVSSYNQYTIIGVWIYQQQMQDGELDERKMPVGLPI